MHKLINNEINITFPWWERHGGFVVSIALYIALFSTLISNTLPITFMEDEFKSVKVILKPPIQQINNQTENQDNLLPPSLNVAATTTDLEDPAESLMEQSTIKEMQEEINPAIINSKIESENPTETLNELPIQQRTITEQDLEQTRNRIRELSRSLVKSRNDIKEYLNKETIATKGSKFELDSEGDATGPVRIFQVDGYPQSAVDYVFKKYGIKIAVKYIKEEGNFSYLNAAKTKEGTFYNRQGAGLYEVFQLTPKALSKMSSLEMQALIRGGYDPTKTQITELRFGLGLYEGEWDIVIVKFQAREIP